MDPWQNRCASLEQQNLRCAVLPLTGSRPKSVKSALSASAAMSVATIAMWYCTPRRGSALHCTSNTMRTRAFKGCESAAQAAASATSTHTRTHARTHTHAHARAHTHISARVKAHRIKMPASCGLRRTYKPRLTRPHGITTWLLFWQGCDCGDSDEYAPDGSIGSDHPPRLLGTTLPTKARYNHPSPLRLPRSAVRSTHP